MKNQSSSCTEDMLNFIRKSPCGYHAVENIKKRLLAEGFEECIETERWQLRPGGDYFVTRNGSSLIAFRIPEERGRADVKHEEHEEHDMTKGYRGFHIVASHCDSPSFKIKENPEMESERHYVRINTEKYGGMILSTWFDRALSVAGRIVARDVDGSLSTRLVNVKKDLMVIPSLAIHMNRKANDGAVWNPQIDLLPLYGECGAKKADSEDENVAADGVKTDLTEQAAADAKTGFWDQVAEAAEVDVENILAHDLFLYVREKGRIIGGDGEFVLSPRLDDLQCVFASAKALIEMKPRDYISVCAVFDNEEVGSSTRQGADSTFLEDTLWRISAGLKMDREDYLRMIAGSFLISADNAHAVHPNHQEKADPTNRPYLNKGIVIKYHGSQRYTTDAVSAAQIKEWCRKADVPYQTYTNRSDILGGSTLGNISASHVSLVSADIGLPQLAMHSAVETAGARDTEYAVKLMKVFYVSDCTVQPEQPVPG